VDLNTANTPWKPDAECPVHTLARHDIPAAWDFAEALPLGDASGFFLSAYERRAASIAPAYVGSDRVATVQSADACLHPLPDASAAVWFTDPPYYDSVPYAHLSDFFYVWEKRASPESSTNDHTALTPKDQEIVVDRAHSAIPDAKTPAQFERQMAIAMSEGARVVKDDGIAAVVFAHKTTEGWEALLSGMVAGGWVITNSWPIITEMQARLNARENASLAASVHLICRPRSAMTQVGDWSSVLQELPNRIGDWMERLSTEGVHGADLVFRLHRSGHGTLQPLL
jgi:putative DNA methylase